MSEKMREEFGKWYASPAGDSGLTIGDCLDGDGRDTFTGFCGGFQSRQSEIDTHVAAEELALAKLQKAEAKIAKLKNALFEARYALTHPDDGWRNDVVNRALGIINCVIKQKED